MKFNFIKKWRKKAAVKRISTKLIEEPLYKTLKNLNEELPYSIEVSKALYSTKKIAKIPVEKIQKTPKDVSDNIYKLRDPEMESNKIRKEIHNFTYSSYSGGMYDTTFKIKNLKILD